MVQHVICPKCEKTGHKIQLTRQSNGNYVCARCHSSYKLSPKSPKR